MHKPDRKYYLLNVATGSIILAKMFYHPGYFNARTVVYRGGEIFLNGYTPFYSYPENGIGRQMCRVIGEGILQYYNFGGESIEGCVPITRDQAITICKFLGAARSRFYSE